MRIKGTCQIVAVLAVTALVSGCASTKGYFADRGRDALDVLTVTAGVGAGAKVKAGPFAIGLLSNSDRTGLKSGQIFTPDTLGCISDEFHLLLIGEDMSAVPGERYKTYKADYLLGIPLPVIPGPFGADCYYPPTYFTQFEVVVGLGATFKVGFNPGELCDFLLGWFGFDIYGDDLEARKRRRPSNNPAHATGKPAPDR